jgi:protein-tyrosine phosphatase
MIDIHCHILPGIDDGAKALPESLEMARIFEQTGYSHVVATPHAVPGTTWMTEPEDIQIRLVELNRAIAKAGIQLKVLPGMEIALDPNIVGLLDHGKLQTLAGTSYVLIEPPFQRLPLGWEHAIFDVLSRGYKILLAHPERCAQLATKPQLCDQLIESGAYFQVNWDSFSGHHGRTTQKMAIYLASKGFIHCLATDSHDAVHRNPSQAQTASNRIEELIGLRNLRLIANENPIQVLRNEALKSMERQEIQASEHKIHRFRRLTQIIKNKINHKDPQITQINAD